MEVNRRHRPEEFGEDPNKFSRVLSFEYITAVREKINSGTTISKPDCDSLITNIDNLGNIGYFESAIKETGEATDEEQFTIDRNLVARHMLDMKLLLQSIRYKKDFPQDIVDRIYDSVSEHLIPGSKSANIMLNLLNEAQLFPASSTTLQKVMEKAFTSSPDLNCYIDFVANVNTHVVNPSFPRLSIERMQELIANMKDSGMDTSRHEEYVEYLKSK